ncbi:GntR family transcriptional regulator [bacterium]|nr:GntR family transcriptional regulator [bacterium]
MDFQLPLDLTCGKPIYKQISEGIRTEIANGRLRPLEKLPSTRDLGSTLNCSRFTVMRSYEELVSAGYIAIATGSGAYVSAQPAGPVDIKTNANLDSKPIEPANGDAKLSRFGKNMKVTHWDTFP